MKTLTKKIELYIAADSSRDRFAICDHEGTLLWRGRLFSKQTDNPKAFCLQAIKNAVMTVEIAVKAQNSSPVLVQINHSSELSPKCFVMKKNLRLEKVSAVDNKAAEFLPGKAYIGRAEALENISSILQPNSAKSNEPIVEKMIALSKSVLSYFDKPTTKKTPATKAGVWQNQS